ncbi:MAG: triose-phosphate isomerase [Chlorobi bacterium]|nr:triose-phosphate isomerase [Chlorobiota bacterium]
MRKNIVAGNWKMNKTLPESVSLVKEIISLLNKENSLQAEVIVAPTYVSLYEVNKLLKGSKIKLSAQNSASEHSGAYTGEISAEMIKAVGCDYVILGHSERRAYYGERDAILTRKVEFALKNELEVIFCIGERLLEREKGEHFKVVEGQLKNTVFNLSENEFSNIIIAYEPIWAIGTGVTASSEQAQEMHAFIRKLITENYNTDVADNTTILYGGSCKPSNAVELFKNPDVDGGLIGGAALKAEDFVAIIKSF